MGKIIEQFLIGTAFISAVAMIDLITWWWLR